MSEMLYTAGTGAMAQEKRLEMLTNNIANVNSAGYKADRPAFRAYLPGADNAEAPAPLKSTSGTTDPSRFAVSFDGQRTDFSTGILQHTGNALDVAIVGDGFFSIQTPDGPEYTRNGQFTLNADGVLVTQNGFPVSGDGGEITIEGAEVKFASDGTVMVDGASVGKLALVNFENPDELMKTTGCRFKAPENVAPAAAEETVSVRQGTIEQANVNAVQMMSEMIEVLRAYESYQKVMKSSDEVTSKVINEVGRPV